MPSRNEYLKLILNNKIISGGVPIDADRALRIEGHNPSIGGGNIWNDIWEGGANTIPEPSSSGQQVQIVCANAGDSVAGVGVQKVRLDYLTTDNVLAFEIIETNGSTATSVATNITDIIDFHSVQNGSNLVSVGNIDVTDIGNPSLIFNRIAANGNKSMSTLRHFLPSSTAYITSLTVSGDTKGTDVILRSDSTDSGDVYPGTWLFQVPITMSDAPTTVNFSPALVIPGTARLKVSARASSAGNTVSVFINGWVKI